MAVFLIRLLILSVIALPALADDRLTAVLDEPTHVVPLLSVPPIPVSDRREPVWTPGAEIAATPAPFIGDACAPNYWLVSSRCSIQNMRNICREPWGLDVYQRTPDLQLQRTNMPSLSSQLVPGIPVCIFVHGSFVEWESQCREAHAAYTRMQSAGGGAPLQMIFYTWPSDGPYTYIPTIDVGVRGRQAEFNGFHLAWLISQIPESCPVCLIGHSHGARTVFSAMHLAGGGVIQDHVFPYSMGTNRRYRVVLAAAAMDHHWLNPGNRYGCALNRVECVLNLRNRHDVALTVYPLHRPFVRRAFGKTGLTHRDASAIGWNSQKIRECDITAMLGHAHYWPEYYSRPAIVGTMIPYLYFH